MVLWNALLVVLVWAIIRWLNTKTTVSPPQDSATLVGGPSALEMLWQRYARGEIDTATFEQMRAQLEAPGVLDDQSVTTHR